MSQYDAGSVIVTDEKIEIETFSGSNKTDIHHLVTRIDIYESLSNYTLAADFHISEGIELMNNLPIAGEEFITFSFQTPNRTVQEHKFFVDSITNLSSTDTSMMKNYVLRCVTKDFLTNAFTLYTKRYKNKGYDTSLKEVLSTDLGSNKDLVTVEKTTGKFDYVVNRVRPFQVIDLISERAVSGEQNKSSKFIFYEDHKGYNFTTLEKLITDRKSGAESKIFHYSTSNRASLYEEVINHRNILKYETTKQGSSIDKTRSGGMYRQVREFDIRTGTYFYKNWEYKNSSHAKQFKKPDDEDFDLNSTAFSSYVEKLPGQTLMTVVDTTRPDMKHNESIIWKRAFEEKMSQYGLRLKVYGDSDMLVGDIIQVDIPEITGVTVEPELQEIYSGNYMITNLKHVLTKDGNSGDFSHFMALDLRKPNLIKGIG